MASAAEQLAADIRTIGRRAVFFAIRWVNDTYLSDDKPVAPAADGADASGTSGGTRDRPARMVEVGTKDVTLRVAVADIDGILRGKYIHKDKFESAIESGFGFCDVVFGWDCHDVCYDNTTLTGWHKGFPDALARIDLSTHRNVPWDDGVDFFLGEFIVRSDAGDAPFPLDGRQVLKRTLLLIDSRHGIKDVDRDILEMLR